MLNFNWSEPVGTSKLKLRWSPFVAVSVYWSAPVPCGSDNTPSARPNGSTGMLVVAPALTTVLTLPLVPVPVRVAGALINVGCTAIGLRTVVVDPDFFQVRNPVE